MEVKTINNFPKEWDGSVTLNNESRKWYIYKMIEFPANGLVMRGKFNYVFNTRKEAGCLTWRWKQKILCNDLDYLVSIKQNNERIIDWETCEVISKADYRYSQIII